MSLQANLRDLFLLEQQVRGLRSRLDAATNRFTTQKAKFDQLCRQRDELAQQLKQAQVTASTLEAEAAGIETKVAHLREHMNAVKNNKEYSALLVEVNTLKDDKKKIEDQTLEQMGRVEALVQEHEDLVKLADDQQKIVEQANADVETRRGEVGERLDEVTKQRDTAQEQVPEATRILFMRLADAYDGEAMAEVHEESRRHMEYTCGGCYMIIPVEKLNALMTRPDDLVQCPGCKRILYVGEELKSSISK